jgi:hypothetical protein
MQWQALKPRQVSFMYVFYIHSHKLYVQESQRNTLEYKLYFS